LTSGEDDNLETQDRLEPAEILANSSFSHAANKRLLTETDGVLQQPGLAHEVIEARA
jgi:hypothetical protein